MKQTDRNKLRMIEWLAIALALYAISYLMLKHGDQGPIQTAIWKLGHVTMGGYAGYWLDRAAFRDRITPNSNPLLMIRRAIAMAAAIGTLGVGL